MECDGGPKFHRGSDQQFRKVQLIYFALFFSLLTYLAIGLWLRPTPALSGEMKETVIFTRGPLFPECCIHRSDLYVAEENIPPASHSLSVSARGFEANELLQGGSIVNLCSLRSNWAVWDGSFVSDRFRSTLLELNARVHYLDGLTLPP